MTKEELDLVIHRKAYIRKGVLTYECINEEPEDYGYCFAAFEHDKLWFTATYDRLLESDDFADCKVILAEDFNLGH